MQKTNFKTRLLALLTAVFMLVMCVPFAAFAETTDPADREKIIVNFTDADGNTTPVTIVKDAVSPTAPEAKDGKWVSDSGAPELNGGESLTWTEMDRWAAGDWNKTAYISYTFKANEKKPEGKTDPAVREKIIVNFTDADGNTTPVTIVKDAVSPTAPEAKDGKWVSDSGAPELKGGESLIWTEMNRWAAGDWDKTAYISYSFKANEKKPETQKHHFTVNFTVDPEKGSFTGIGAGPVVFQGYEEEVGDQQYEVPAVTAKEGYKFVGWKGQGADVIAWDAEAKTFGISGLCFYQDGSYEGNASIEAQFEEVKPETQKHHFTVNFTVDPEKGSFTGIGAGPVVFQGYEEEVGDQQYEVPAVTAKEGYKFVGWKGQGADVIAWDAEAKTFGISGLCFYQDGSYEGNASIEAVFEKIEDKKDDNSSSSSSSSASSSSNKTTTASNEKQVVKAAAAPANTTKVLPKTGASNVAPLLGGSLAVVALLMGYGVYSLVLRKKD